MLDDFLVRAGLAGLGLAIAAGPLGCFILWRRMAYFGDATAHAAMLGVALALGFQISIFAGVLTVALAVALTVSTLGRRGHSMDSTLGVLSHGGLALGLVAISLSRDVPVDLHGYLFGDVLAVSQVDLAVIWVGALLVVGLLIWRWQALLTATLNPDLAQAAGIRPEREQLVLTVAMALTVAVGLNVVGALLIGAMLIIPAASARSMVRGPEAMAMLAVALGGLSVLGGLQASLTWDMPTGPSIVALAAGLFAISAAIPRRA
ncbi:MAG: metal ABC transporter permease [Pseudomonadota bacterium]